jgi:TolB-like protein
MGGIVAEERVQRRLAAILAADVVGYSRLMRADEAGTRTRFNEQLDENIRPAIEEHRGRLVKTMGDGFLVEFSSVVDAVQCAVNIQGSIAAGQSDEPDHNKILFRIGIHLGDVIVEDDDIHGDGVNIAARLETIAEPNGICLSDMVYAGVRNKLSLRFDDLGERSLKNIADPQRVFRVSMEETTREKSPSDSPIFYRPAVAVLPFENLSRDPDEDYFADGLTEDIITALSLWRSFPVIARNSTFSYKGQSPDVREVGKQLGAKYVIEGSVRKAGNRIRVTAQLINAETGHHVWADRYDRDIADVFELQDLLTQQIVAAVTPELERTEHALAIARQPKNMVAWDYCLRGSALYNELRPEANSAAREMFRKAIELEPGYSRAYTGLVSTCIREMPSHFGKDRHDLCEEAIAMGQRAMELAHWLGLDSMIRPLRKRKKPYRLTQAIMAHTRVWGTSWHSPAALKKGYRI